MIYNGWYAIKNKETKPNQSSWVEAVIYVECDSAERFNLPKRNANHRYDIKGGTHGVMVIVVGNGDGDTSSKS